MVIHIKSAWIFSFFFSLFLKKVFSIPPPKGLVYGRIYCPGHGKFCNLLAKYFDWNFKIEIALLQIFENWIEAFYSYSKKKNVRQFWIIFRQNTELFIILKFALFSNDAQVSNWLGTTEKKAADLWWWIMH